MKFSMTTPANIVEITSRPVTLYEVIAAMRMGTWADRRLLLLHPWPEFMDNVRMWTMLGTICAMGIVHIIGSINHHVSFLLTSIFLSLFSLSILYILQVTTGLSHRLSLRAKAMQESLRNQIQQTINSYGNEIVEELKEATGREDIKSDPISVTAAIIELTKKNRVVSPVNENPFRAILDGTLRPQDLSDSTENDDDTDLF